MIATTLKLNQLQQVEDLNFGTPNFKTSGLLKEFLEAHYILLQSTISNKEQLINKMNKSTLHIVKSIGNDQSLLNVVGNHLFSFLEARNQIEASSFLAVTLLSIENCSLEDNLKNKLESYRKLIIGNIAPDILFADGKKLSDFTTKRVVIVVLLIMISMPIFSYDTYFEKPT